jgi:hypothetical protein
MDVDLLKYSETSLIVCTHGFTRRQIHDVVRQAYNYPKRVNVCPCITDPWCCDILRELRVLHQSNEACRVNRPEQDRELAFGSEK